MWTPHLLVCLIISGTSFLVLTGGGTPGTQRISLESFVKRERLNEIVTVETRQRIKFLIVDKARDSYQRLHFLVPPYSKVYSYKKWKFKLFGKYVRKEMCTQRPIFYFLLLTSPLYFLSLLVPCTFTRASFTLPLFNHYTMT